MTQDAPITVRNNPHGYGRGIGTFVVTTLCHWSQMGMTNTPDLEIAIRRALAHTLTCEQCAARWAVLCTPGATLVSTGEAPHPCADGQCANPAAHAEGAHDL